MIKSNYFAKRIVAIRQQITELKSQINQEMKCPKVEVALSLGFWALAEAEDLLMETKSNEAIERIENKLDALKGN